MADFLKIEFDPGDLSRMRTALDRIDAIVRMQKSDMPLKCAVDYKNLVVQNILTGKFATTYAPYSARYAHWKTVTMLRGSHFWMLYGDLLKNITVFRLGEGWMGGISAHVKDSGGKSWLGTRRNRKGKSKPIAMYGRVIEFGLDHHPARPVFQPTAREYATAGYSLRAIESMNKIKTGWR